MDRTRTLADQIVNAAARPGPDLAAPAFLVARIEYPHLDPEPYLDRIDQLGVDAAHRIARDAGLDAPLPARVDALNRFLFTEVGFTGNREQYDDPRNGPIRNLSSNRSSSKRGDTSRRAGHNQSNLVSDYGLPRSLFG